MLKWGAAGEAGPMGRWGNQWQVWRENTAGAWWTGEEWHPNYHIFSYYRSHADSLDSHARVLTRVWVDFHSLSFCTGWLGRNMSLVIGLIFITLTLTTSGCLHFQCEHVRILTAGTTFKWRKSPCERCWHCCGQSRVTRKLFLQKD